jgi:hypothetical protein
VDTIDESGFQKQSEEAKPFEAQAVHAHIGELKGGYRSTARSEGMGSVQHAEHAGFTGRSRSI